MWLRFAFLGLSRFCSEFFTELVRVGRMFVGLLGKLVSTEMIAFIVGDCGGAVGVGCKIVKLGDSDVWTCGHRFLH
jgi:hypothetical protein